jgi:hypothetical protein
LTAAQAVAVPEFDAAKYPADTTGEATNQQGFEGTGVASNCLKAKASTEEESIVKPTTNKPTLEIHPTYEECILTLLGVTGGKAKVVTTGCNYVFHAAPPGELKGTTDTKCTGKSLGAVKLTEKSRTIKGINTTGVIKDEIITGTIACNKEKEPTKQTAGCILGTGGNPGPEAEEKTWVEKVISATELELNKPIGGSGTAETAGTSTITATHDIQIVSEVVPGCTVFVPAQNGLSFVRYANTPVNEVTLEAEVKGIVTGIDLTCGTGKQGTTSSYRKGKQDVKNEIASLEPEGNPANFQSKGNFLEGAVKVANPTEVGINEGHWYKNKAVLAESAEGLKFIMWGAMTFGSTAMTGTCQTLWGGNVVNSQGGGQIGSGSGKQGSAVAGETRVAGMSAYDCAESTVCETTDASKLFIDPEGLGVVVNGTTPERLEWVGPLSGNANAGTGAVGIGKNPAPTQIKLKLSCPKTTGGEYNKSWVGEQKTRTSEGFVQSTAIGSSPSILRFGTGSGELEVATTVEKATVTATNMKMMGFEGGEELTTHNP